MFESIKNKLWELLEKKEVSLAILYNREGEILWHKGRPIEGKTVQEGDGFSKSYILETLEKPDIVMEDNVIVTTQWDQISHSAHILRIKSLMIIPVLDQFFLYIDSGAKEGFNHTDREIFKVIGDLLGEMIYQVLKDQQDIGGITGTSDVMGKIRELVLKYSLEESPVLLLGETGVGKSRIAELIHRYSGRKGRFFTVNTPSIPDHLLESEIFGHRKGSFTGAHKDKQGYVDEAQGGTLFLDEISEIPMSFQAKLLRFIETRKYLALGDTTEKLADVRIVTATNVNLPEAIENGQFREDLYYRLQVLEIEIPPLRKRKKDIEDIVMEHRELLKGKEIGEGFWEAMANHDWPGNIREVITVLTRAGIHLQSPMTGDALKEIINQSQFKKGSEDSNDRTDELYRTISQGQTFWEAVWDPFIRRYLNRDQVKSFLVEGYQNHQHSLKKLSQSIGIKDSEFKRFISALHKYEIHPAKYLTLGGN